MKASVTAELEVRCLIIETSRPFVGQPKKMEGMNDLKGKNKITDQ